MKAILFFSLSIFAINRSFAQSITKLKVPQVKESFQIDSLIEKGIYAAIPGKSCILLDLYMRNGPIFVLSVLKTDVSVFDLGVERSRTSFSANYRNDLRFFNYKGFIVFVIGMDDPYKLFAQTKKYRQFSFLNTFSEKEKRDLFGNAIYCNFYKYETDHFVSLIEPVY